MDGDDDLDLYFVQGGSCVRPRAERSGNRMFKNRGDGTFEDVTERAGIVAGSHTGAAFLDFDRDGLLDLFVGQYVDVDVAVTAHRAIGTN